MRMKVLDTVLSKYEKAKGSLCEKVAVDLLPLDYVTDGGIPIGKIVEIYGENGTGKTTISMYIMRKYMEKIPNKSVVFIDAEYSFNADWANKVGINVENAINANRLYIIYPSNMDDAFQACLDVAKTQEASLIVLDSLATLIPKEVFAEDNVLDFSRPGLTAKKQTIFFETINPLIEKNKITFIVINQVRANISPYGASKSVPGAFAFKHLTSLRLETKREEFIGSKETPSGISMTVKCHKNKTGIPFRSENIDISTTNGLLITESNVNYMLARGIIQRNGPMYTIGDIKLKGKEAVIEYLTQNENVYKELLKNARVCP